MNTFKRKALFTAVLAGLGAAGTAEAVYLNPNNTGQVLVYPYYTVQNANNGSFNTYLSVVNTTSRAKAVKVRILEGKTSAEVLDFNLFLSPNDMWTAAIEPSDGTDGSAARIFTTDRSCTNPVGNLRRDLGGTGEPFRNFVLIENIGGVGLPGTGLERTREGYVEFIEMGTLTGTWAAAVTHTAAGTPSNCAVVQTDATPTSIEAPTGGLVGTGTLINVNNGQDMTYKADALEAWRDTAFYSPPAALSPSLQDADPPISLVVNAGGIGATGASTALTAYRTTFVATSGVSAGARAVASVFMHASVINEFVLDNDTDSLTDWVITQPLKHPYFVTNVTARQPYTNVLTSSGACELITFTYFNREEASVTAAGSDFSPPGSVPAQTLCWESTVLSIINSAPGATHMPSTAAGTPSGVLGSRNVRQVNVGQFQNGWANLTFSATGAATLGMGGVADRLAANTETGFVPAFIGPAAVTFFGLPVTGFMVRNFANGTLTCGTGACQGNYGGLFRHSYRNRITP